MNRTNTEWLLRAVDGLAVKAGNLQLHAEIAEKTLERIERTLHQSQDEVTEGPKGLHQIDRKLDKLLEQQPKGLSQEVSDRDKVIVELHEKIERGGQQLAERASDIDDLEAENGLLKGLLGSHVDGHECSCTMISPQTPHEPADWEQDPWCMTHSNMGIVSLEAVRMASELKWIKQELRDMASVRLAAQAKEDQE